MSKANPLISVCVPIHNMANRDFFLERLQNSLEAQTYRNFEVIITEEGLMAENSNAAIKKANGDIIKILYMDDYLYSEDALLHISQEFKGGWLATGCVHDDGTNVGNPHVPSYHPDSFENSIGSPSVVAFTNDDPLLFDEKLSWMLDVDLYARLYERYGFPTLIPTMDIAIGIHPGQVTNLMPEDEKQEEVDYVLKKHG